MSCGSATAFQPALLQLACSPHLLLQLSSLLKAARSTPVPRSASFYVNPVSSRQDLKPLACLKRGPQPWQPSRASFLMAQLSSRPVETVHGLRDHRHCAFPRHQRLCAHWRGIAAGSNDRQVLHLLCQRHDRPSRGTARGTSGHGEWDRVATRTARGHRPSPCVLTLAKCSHCCSAAYRGAHDC